MRGVPRRASSASDFQLLMNAHRAPVTSVYIFIERSRDKRTREGYESWCCFRGSRTRPTLHLSLDQCTMEQLAFNRATRSSLNRDNGPLMHFNRKLHSPVSATRSSTEKRSDYRYPRDALPPVALHNRTNDALSKNITSLLENLLKDYDSKHHPGYESGEPFVHAQFT